MKKILTYIIILLMPILLLTGCATMTDENDNNFKIVTSFYPVYIMTLNIVDGADNVKVENMTSEQIGCIHDYTLKTNDLLKVENADVLIQNGSGLEEFIDKILEIYSDLPIIDSSKGIENIENPHTWVNINNYINQINNIKNNLISLNPQNAVIYEQNAKQYIEKINTELKNLDLKSNINAITFNETLYNIIDSSKINMAVINIGHEETALSAEQLASLVDKMKNENIKIIFVDKNESHRNAEILKNETGAIIYELDSYIRGELNRDTYLNSLKQNISILNSIQ